MNQKTNTMKKFIILAAIIPSIIFGQNRIGNRLDSQFREDIKKARFENGISVISDKNLDELAKKRVLALKKVFQSNWGKGINLGEGGSQVLIGGNPFRNSYSHGIKANALPAGFIYDKKDTDLLPFPIFEGSIRGISYKSIEENHTYPIPLSESELLNMSKKLEIPKGYFSIFKHYSQSQRHFASVTGLSLKDRKNRRFGSYAEIFEVEKGKYILFHVAIFVGS